MHFCYINRQLIEYQDNVLIKGNWLFSSHSIRNKYVALPLPISKVGQIKKYCMLISVYSKNNKNMNFNY